MKDANTNRRRLGLTFGQLVLLLRMHERECLQAEFDVALTLYERTFGIATADLREIVRTGSGWLDDNGRIRGGINYSRDPLRAESVISEAIDR